MSAEAATTAVINKAIDLAANKVGEIWTRVQNLPEDIKWIEDQMRTLQSYLKDADMKKSTSHEAKNLIISIRDLADDVEDILDMYLPEIESHISNTKGIIQYLKQLFFRCIMCYPVKATDFSSEIEKIRKRVEDIEITRERSGVIATDVASIDAVSWDSRKSFLTMPELEIFGRDEVLRKLEEHLLSTNLHCKIISVVGPGGVGKTTVAKKIYQKVKNKFECCAIVYVSQEPKFGEILQNIAKQVGLEKDQEKENLDEDQRKEKLRLFLQEKRYVIFLDDIWNINTWERLKVVFSSNSQNCSRVIVTSRYDDVGRYIYTDESHLIKLDVLSEEEGQKLLFSKIPLPEGHTLPPAFKEIGDKIVEKCGGLPLAIEVAGGLLKARERTNHAWNQVLQTINDGVGDQCRDILGLSYQDLPTELKPLFLYFGMFPEDHEIFVSDLFHAWVVEKFIPFKEGKKSENIAQANLDNLIARNLIQVSRRRSNGSIKSCRIHDLLHSFCIRVAEENNLFCTDVNNPESSIARRITINSSDLDKDSTCPKKLRTLFYFKPSAVGLSEFLKRNDSNLRFLKHLVIEVEGDDQSIPEEIGNLISLKSLKLKGDKLQIPSSIGRLKNLLTFEVDAKYGSIPLSICKMKQLKHLLGRSGVEFKRQRMCWVFITGQDFPNLETLDSVIRVGYFALKMFKKFTNLRKLGVSTRSDYLTEFVSVTTLAMQKLEVLNLNIFHLRVFEGPVLNLSRYLNLVKLKLNLIYDSSVVSLEFPPSLVQITFRYIVISPALIESMKKLPKLEILKMKKCSCRSYENLDFSGEHGFPELQVLYIWKMEHLESLIVDKKGMPKLAMISYTAHEKATGSHNLPDRLWKMMD